MTWKRRQQELLRLRRKYIGARMALAFPDLSCAKPGLAPTSDRLTECATWSKGIKVADVTISHLHKSGYQVLGKAEVQYASRKV